MKDINIKATIRKSGIAPKWTNIICYIEIILCILFFLVSLIMIVFYLEYAFVFGDLLFLLFLLLFIYLLINNKKNHRYIEDCLKDAKYIYVRVQKYSELDMFAKPNQIIVTFVFEGIGHRMLSNAKDQFRGRYFLKYIGNKVKVLYSPKYDDVLFFEEKEK